MDKKSRFCLCQVKVHLQCTNIYERMYLPPTISAAKLFVHSHNDAEGTSVMPK